MYVLHFINVTSTYWFIVLWESHNQLSKNTNQNKCKADS
jgi:hypothetical protein